MKNESKGTSFLRDEERMRALHEHHVAYVCNQCGDKIWMVKSDGLGDSLLCPWPCGGVRQRQKPPEWWEEET